MRDDFQPCDVLVVGAGISGLVSARRLVEHGASVQVLEARERVGGRTWSQNIRGAMLDLGGQWVGPQQTAVRSLADQLGLELFPTYIAGRKILQIDGKLSSYSGDIPSLSAWNLVELQLAISKLDRQARKVDPQAPHEAPDAAELDAVTVHAWMKRHIHSKRVRSMFALLVQSILSAEPAEVSMLFLLHYVAAAGGLEPLIQADDGAQQDRFVDGAQSLSLKMLEGLGDRVVLGAPVTHIFQDKDGITALSERGEHRGRFMVMSAPPALAGRINYDPPMPANRDQLTQRMPMGRTIKCLITYQDAFWRKAGYSGEVVTPHGILAFVYDNGSHDGEVPGLVAFITADRVRDWAHRPAGERQEAVLGELVVFFGAAAATPETYLEQDWNAEPFSGGGPVGVATPGALTGTGEALVAPVDRIHFGGTETADRWCGFMEGAVRAGERAAMEIVARL